MNAEQNRASNRSYNAGDSAERAYESMRGFGTVPQPDVLKDIPGLLRLQEELISTLQTQLNELAIRLEPIIWRDEDRTSASPEEHIGCALGKALSVSNERIKMILAQVSNLILGLQL